MRFRSPIRARAGWLAAACVAALAPLLAASPAAAGTPAPTGSYLLKVTPQDGTAARTATLTCGPDGGTHADPAAACAQLRRTGGRVEGIPESQGACTLEYAPVRVSATGTWQGRQYRYERTYPNRCAAVRATGGVLFAF
ncbi:hypothetical protein GCM10010466_66600 [Planomonospora alba]|uniref:Subtilisin inhibitor domain-containing protein n=1 Tax=Planomonospora alba TaxID=161354 RepID=A0ABP6P436_9ACTN